jgi:hypothetical protein
MSGQGYHLALDRRQVDELISCGDEMRILDWVDEALESCRTAPDRIHGGYKDWSILLCCLTNGDYDPRGGTYPLNHCFFGGRLLVSEGSIVNLVTPEEVVDVAEALDRVDQADFGRRYRDALPAFPSGVRPIAKRYLAEFYEKLLGLRDFYQYAAREGRAVLFYTDDPLDYFFKTDSAP